ncbi:MAG: hypothetical protein JWN14_2027 [Chthonomonadales bacterium]|nr:hypothetical protein [Chthonomonadales bacterium]
MKRSHSLSLYTVALLGALCAPIAHAQKNPSPEKPKPAPVIIRATRHAAHFNDFQIRRSKDRSLEAEIKNKGLDLAFTEWMQRDHPQMFQTECIKQAPGIAAEFKSTTHMVDFDKLIEKRPDLRLAVAKKGHDAAFTEWLRTEHPDLYRRHFGLDANNKPIHKSDDKHKGD